MTASRMSASKLPTTSITASIVTAAGIPEMICAGPDDYVRRAIGFTRDPASLAAVRESLASQRETCALRDMPALARRLEELFLQMQGDAERGQTPVPDLRNLDVYYEIGAGFATESIEFEDDAAYRARYRAQLAILDDFAPLQPDSRLWPAAGGQ